MTAPTAKPAVLISRCLLGIPCRYHGQLYRRGRRIGDAELVERLRAEYRLIDICPECDAGMPTPRPPTKIIEGCSICDGRDVTEVFRHGAEIALKLAKREGCRRAWLKNKSPSCDRRRGMCAKLLRENGIDIEGVD